MFVKNQSNHLVEVEIQRFPKVYRRRLRRLVTGSNALADLLVSFPAAAFALVSGYRTAEARGLAIRLVKDGASLKAVAEALDLPLWLRRMPPEAFAAPFGEMPNDAELGRRISHLVPEDGDTARMWFDAVMQTAPLGDTVFTAWIAGKPPLFALRHPLRADAFRLLAAYAWFSANGNTVAGDLVGKAWRHNQALGTVIGQAARFALATIQATQRVAPKRGPGRYSARNRVSGFAIVALSTAADLDEEGRVMSHCVGSYAGEVARGECLIFGVRIDGQRIATMEVRGSVAHGRMPRIVQIQGPGNSTVDAGVVDRARVWLMEHASDPVAAADADQTLSLVDEGKWRQLWAPYRAAAPVAFASPGAFTPAAVRTAAGVLQQLGQGGLR